MSNTTSTSTSLSGIFAKFVAKFFVKWIKKTLGIGQADTRPALSPTPSQVTGRPERDRARETLGEHTGSQGARADESPEAAAALQGDDYGAHRGMLEDRPYRHQSPEERRASMWTGGDLEQQREVLRGANPEVLREFGMGEKQVSQCQHGRVPSGHIMDKVATNTMLNWVLTPNSPENQLLSNSFHNQLIDIRIGETRILSVPFNGSVVVLVLGAAS